MIRKAVLAGIAMLGLSSAGAVAAPITIDNFSSSVASDFPLVESTSSTTPVTVNETGQSGVLGGARSVSLGPVTTDINGLDHVEVNVYVSASVFDVSSTSGAQGDVSLKYGSYAGSPFSTSFVGNGVLALDFTQFNAPAGQPLTIDASLDSGGTSVALPEQVVSTPGAQMVEFPLVGLSQSQLGSVDGVEFTFGPSQGGEYRLNSIDATNGPNVGTPEPTTLAGLGLAGLALLSRRRRKV